FVAVALEPADHRVFGIEEEIFGAVTAGVEGAVVGDFVGALAAAGLIVVEALSAVVVVGLPGLVGGFVDDVGGGGVVADDEGDLAGTGAAVVLETGEVDAARRVGGDGPTRADGPVAAIELAGGVVGDAGGL